MDELDRSRRLARRRMAWVSFCMLTLEAVVLLLGVFFGGPVFAVNVAAASSLLVGLFFAQATVIGAYLGVSMAEAMKR